MLEEIMLRLPCPEAIALGSTCHALRQLLQPIRPTKVQQYLQSDALAPELQMKAVDLITTWADVGIVQLYLSWTVQASRTLFHLMTKEKVAPSALWDAIIPQMAIQGPKEYLSVICSFGCLDWLAGSMQQTDGQTFLYRLARSDLSRIDRSFSALQEIFVSEGIQEKRVFIHLCKNEPDIAKQRDAALVVYWADGNVRTK